MTLVSSSAGVFRMSDGGRKSLWIEYRMCGRGNGDSFSRYRQKNLLFAFARFY
ncbi:hypothetical protein [Streptomyces sp. S465]|uniref:hypothetical protein n=1 Tax=Streptomyces sp. S465 TaxID=2979468 RepID=UPI0022A8273C|nr:hypothetical protein [Streptomyces sp. S465]WAP60446.1 hypothetical protein N6H00_38785 [Streptomyces sp. S465]